MTNLKKDADSSDEEILRVARERWDIAELAWRPIYAAAKEDLEFLAGNQWPDNVKRERDADSRPCLTINRMPQFIRQITNDQRQNRPSIKVSPVDDKADVDTAKILQGLIRHIETNSNADVAYDTAFEGAVGPSFGFYRILTDYVSPDSFDQEIKIGRVPNPFSILIDPFSKEPDGSDMTYGFVVDMVSRETYKIEYKDSELCNEGGWESLGNTAPGWITDNSVRVTEYFTKEYKDITLVQLLDGRVVDKSLLPGDFPQEQIAQERKSRFPVVKWYKLNGVEILDRGEWAGCYIPIVPVYGNEIIIDGVRILEGVIRHAKDPQRMYNYWASTETETIALAPKAPFIMATGQIPVGLEHMWETANSKSHAYLLYEATDVDGKLIGPPQRNVYEPPVQAITNARLQSSEDLKATTGIYDAALGNRSNESSGVAIQRRNMQAQTSNFHFIDNLTRSLRHTGRILVDLIPKIYDTERTARIIGEEGNQEIVKINALFQEHGKDKIYDLGAGKYDVVVETGPSFATKRQEAQAMLLEFMKIVPQKADMIADLVADNSDWAGKTALVERLRKLLPEGLIEDKDKTGPPPLPPEVQKELQDMEQMIHQLSGALEEAKEAARIKKIELESKEKIEFAKMEVDLIKEEMKQKTDQNLDLVLKELAHLHARLELVGINEPITVEESEPQQNFNQPINGSGPDQAGIQQQQQQPTGGSSPGNYIGE